MAENNSTFQQFKAYWQLSEQLISGATKEDLAETARILALQVAHYARKYGELPIPDFESLLSATSIDEDSVMFLRDGTEALVGVMAMVTGRGGVNIDAPLQ